MPYEKLNDLPDAVRGLLPDHAQETYLETFNEARNHYRLRRYRGNTLSRETVAHRTAWSVVTQKCPWPRRISRFPI